MDRTGKVDGAYHEVQRSEKGDDDPQPLTAEEVRYAVSQFRTALERLFRRQVTTEKAKIVAALREAKHVADAYIKKVRNR
jgi:hypothetical protein